MDASITAHADRQYELCFRSLSDPSQALGFPCDANGRVDLDTLSERVRIAYFYARTVIGREFAMPAVTPRVLH